MNLNNFLKPEDEALFRVEIRQLYRKIGLRGIMTMLGEMFHCINIICEVVGEELNEQAKKDKEDEEEK